MKLIEILKTLERKELNGFGRYVQAMVKDEKPYLLFQQLKKRYPHFDFEVKDKEKLFKKIYKKSTYTIRDAKTLNYLLSDLTLTLEEYLMILHTRKNKEQRQFLLMDYYKANYQDKLFEKTSSEILERLEQKKVKQGDYYLNKMRVYYDLYFHVPADKKRIESQTNKANEIIDSIDEFYAYYKLKIESDFKAMGAFSIDRPKQFLLKELLASIHELKIVENPLIPIYQFAIKHFEEANESYYEAFKEKVIEVLPNLSQINQNDMMSSLYSYLIHASRKGLYDYQKYLFELYQLGFDNEYSVYNNRIDHQQFANAIIMAVAVNQIKWGKKMIEQHKDKLDSHIKDDCVQLCFANLAYAEKDYEEVLFQLNTIQNFRHYTFGVQGRMLLMKCYYDLEIQGQRQGELIYNFADSFRNYMKRSKVVTSQFKTGIINYIKFTMRILNNHFYKKEHPEKIREEMMNYKHPLFAKRWLNLKLDEQLKKGRF